MLVLKLLMLLMLLVLMVLIMLVLMIMLVLVRMVRVEGILDHRRGLHRDRSGLHGRGRGNSGDRTGNARLERLLQCRDLLHHDHCLLGLRPDLPTKLLVLLAHALDLLAQLDGAVYRGMVVEFALALPARARRRLAHAVAVTINAHFVLAVTWIAVALLSSIGMQAAKVLGQVFLAPKAFAFVTLAGWMRAKEHGLGAAIQVVDFATVPRETTGIGKAEDLFAIRAAALVWPLVLVHMLAICAI